MVNITRIGRYVPRYRLRRSAIAGALSGVFPGQLEGDSGYRAVCASDEDATTLAVAAALDTVGMAGQAGSILLGAIAPTHSGRQDAAIVADVLAMASAEARDVIGMRAGTSALIQAIRDAQATGKTALALAVAHQRPLMQSPRALAAADTAIGMLVGTEPGLARYLGSCASTVDSPAQFQVGDRQVAYHWEERWSREVSVQLAESTVTRLLQSLQVNPSEIAMLVWPVTNGQAHRILANRIGISSECRFFGADVQGPDHGIASALIQLDHALSCAERDEKILLIDSGQGCEALLFVASGTADRPESAGATGAADEGIEVSYATYLRWAGLIDVDRGLRAEGESLVSLSLRHRHASFLARLQGGRCMHCATPQLPMSLVCVRCAAVRTQVPVSFATTTGTLRTWSADYLAASDAPPVLAGLIDFEGGGRLMMALTDCQVDEIHTGMRVKPAFRVRSRDPRGHTQYFWKAAPAAASPS